MIVKQKLPKKIKPKDPFFGYFLRNNGNGFSDKLLQSNVASFWSKLIANTFNKGQYNYQQSSETKSTSQVQLNNEHFLNISSYDYLGLIGNEDIEQASINATRDYGTSTGGVRLLSGSNVLHEELESKLAAFKGTEGALTYSSGYMANLAVISSLVGEEDKVFIDEKIHKSMIDALMMAHADFEKFHHNDFDDLKVKLQEGHIEGKCFVILEGIYSMDGSIVNLPEFIKVKEEFGCFLIVDEAHSFGVLGENGRGVDEHYHIPANKVDIWTSSLSKAIPANGGFVAGSRELMIYLQHQSSPYVFSSALNPGSVAAIIKSLEVIEQNPEKLSKLWQNTNYFLNKTRSLGINTGISESPVTPVIIGSKTDTFNYSAQLYAKNILAPAAIFPAVPFNQGRLRICMSAAFEKEELDYMISAIFECFNPDV
jgi:8-amino-7-oxononanoate synthase